MKSVSKDEEGRKMNNTFYKKMIMAFVAIAMLYVFAGVAPADEKWTPVAFGASPIFELPG